MKKSARLSKHAAIFHAAAANISRHRLRSVTIIVCLVAILSPLLSALAVLEGVKSQALISVDEGADIYVTMDLFGRNGAIPIDMVAELGALDGVLEAVPRTVGRTFINGRAAILLGLPCDKRTFDLTVFDGAPPQPGEVAVGRRLAGLLGLKIGDDISLGTRAVGIIDGASFAMKRMYRVAGLLDASADIRASDLVLMDIEDASSVYNMDGFATDAAIYVKPETGAAAKVVEGLRRMNGSFRVQTRELVRTYVERGLNTRGGVFIALYMVAVAVAVPAILVSAGIGLPERKKEFGVLKATGWQTGEVMELTMFENLLYACLGASSALLVSFIWVRLLNGFFIARLFISGSGNLPSFPLPSQFLFLPFLCAFVLSLAVTMAGSLLVTWRTAVVVPSEALR